MSIFLYLTVYMILFAYSINFSILNSIHDIFLYLVVYMAYIHITLVTHIISILGSIPLFSRLFNIHIYFSCHGIHFVYCI